MVTRCSERGLTPTAQVFGAASGQPLTILQGRLVRVAMPLKF